MKILLVVEPGLNGVFRYVETLASFLIEQQMEVHLAYSDCRFSSRLWALIEHVERNGGRTVNLSVSSRPTLGDVRALWRLRALAAEVRPDIIHCHSAKAGGLARLLPLTGLTGPRYIYHPHAYIGMRPSRHRTDFIYDTIERILARWSTTLCCSHDEFNYSRHTLRIPAHSVMHTSNGVDCDRFRPASPERRAELRKKFGLPETGLVLGTMGRTSEQKDPLTLYGAFARAARQRPGLTLFHVGCGELDGELDKFIKAQGLGSRVVRLKYLSTPAEFYQAIDGFILTSRYEGLSLALLEALATDLPLVLSEAPGNMDVLDLPLTQAWSAPVGDEAAFFGAISQWAQARSRPQPPPPNHRAIMRERFDQNKRLMDVVGVYQSQIPIRGRMAPLVAR
ncbi:MAG TPA: glycosyltransferase [Rariglobus sp.]